MSVPGATADFRLTPLGRARELRFGLWFLGIAGLLFVAYCFPYEEGGGVKSWFDAYLKAYANAAGSILSLFDRKVHVEGQDILGRYPLRIIKTCDAMEAKILLTAAVLACPAPWRWRIGAAFGSMAILFAVNIVRICSLYYVGVYLPGSFQFIHIEVWPLLLVAIAVGLFVAWAAWVRSREARHVTR